MARGGCPWRAHLLALAWGAHTLADGGMEVGERPVPGRNMARMSAVSAVADLGARAKAASRVLATASTEAKDAALAAGADLLV